MSNAAPVLGGRARPFGLWERMLAIRYLRARRSQGGVGLISVISFIGITLAVATLIIVMSVMNGFRTELLTRILGFNGHIYVAGPGIDGPGRDAFIARIKACHKAKQNSFTTSSGNNDLLFIYVNAYTFVVAY